MSWTETPRQFPGDMKPSEFYEKYFKIIDHNGNAVSPRQLTEAEAELMDNCFKDGYEGLMIISKRRRTFQVNFDALERKMEQHLPEFLKKEIDEAADANKP